jgi:D-3-phosphoglycerate dehydrogenase
MSKEAAFRVVVTDSQFADIEIERAVLAAVGAVVERVSALTAEDVVRTARDADGLLVQWAPVDAGVIAALEKCRVISRYGIGVDNVDVAAAASRGIAVTNVPDYCIDEVADHTIALVAACLRGFAPLGASIRGGRWEPTLPGRSVRRFSETTLGVVGMGRIGQLVARRAKGLGMNVVGFDPYTNTNQDVPMMASLHDLLSESEVVTLHCALVPDTRNLIGRAEFTAMRSTAFLINTARGALVDEVELVDALRSGSIAGAGLDVFDTEPLSESSPLRSFDNVVLTPHSSWFTLEALEALRRRAAENVAAVLTGNEAQASLVGPWRAGGPGPQHRE